MKSLILFTLFITTVLFSQQRILVTPENEAIPLRKSKSAFDTVKHRTAIKSKKTIVCDSNFFSIEPPPNVNFLAGPQDVLAMWFEASATGTIDTIFWWNGVAYFDLVSVRLFQSNISPNSGPCFNGLPCPRTPWGFYTDTNDIYRITPFRDQATDPTWHTCLSESTWDPLGDELWGKGGYEVGIISNEINQVPMMALGYKPLVHKNDVFTITIRNMTPDSIPCIEGCIIEFLATTEGLPFPPRNWKFYERDPQFPEGTCAGWWARGQYNFEIWYTMTITGDIPPNILSFEKLTHTLSTNQREVRAEIEDCYLAHPESAIVVSARIYFNTNGGTSWDSTNMTNIGGNTWSGFIPGFVAGTRVRYYMSAYDINRNSTFTSFDEYKIISLSNAYYTLDTSTSYNWVEIESTGTAISNWFGSENTAGPFDLGGTFRFFGSDVRYAWIGVNGALSLSATPTDTIRINLCPASYPKDIPSNCLPRNFISPFFNDLTVGDGGVYFQQSGSKFIVEWNSVRNSADSTDTATFQVILDRSDNSIIFQYNDIGTSGLDSSALVGLQLEPTEKWFFVNQNGAPPELRPRNGKAIRLKPNFTLQVHAGWNLISNTVTVSHPRKSILFPTAVSSAFTFENGYIPKDTIKNGVGYWLKFNSDQTLGINGDTRLADTIEVKQGWNIIGSISVPVPVSSIVQIPAGILASDFFKYTGSGYASADTIKPGYGYWVKAKQIGKIILK